jgi:hypothetical protein
MHAISRLLMTFVGTLLLCGLVLTDAASTPRLWDSLTWNESVASMEMRGFTWILFLVGVGLTGLALSGRGGPSRSVHAMP